MSHAVLPLVTVTFVAWQRREALRRGIESCISQDYPRIEILVIDNSPTDEIHRWLLEAYPQVKSIKTARPIPLPAARNLAVATAAGDLVFFHDDDSRFAEPTDLSQGVDFLLSHPDAAALAFGVQDGSGERNPQFDGNAPCQTYNFVACATLFRREDFQEAGWYFEEFWLYGEERVMSLGYFGLGKTIYLFPAISIIHEPEPTGRVRDNAARYWTADVVMVPGAALLKFPMPDVLLWWPVLLGYYTLQVALHRRRPLLAAKAFLAHARMVPAFFKHRAPISRENFRRWRSVRGTFQRQYLQRTGRWRAYHQFLPAS